MPACLFLIGLFGYLLPAVGYFRAVPGDLADARFNSVILEHVYRWMMGRDSELWSPPFFFPFKDILAFSDNHFGSVAFYALFRRLGLAREQAFDAWFMTGYFLNFIACCYTLRRLGFSALAVAAGAFVFTFSLPVLAQDGHAQLTYRFPVPLAFLALWSAMRNGQLEKLGAILGWLAIQFLCSIYLGVFLAEWLGCVALLGLLSRQRIDAAGIVHAWALAPAPASRRLLSIATATTGLVAIAMLLHKYKFVAGEYSLGHPDAEILSMLPRVESYFIADRSRLSGFVGNMFGELQMRHEHQLFFGFGVLALATLGYFGSRSGQKKASLGAVWAISVMMMVLATISLHGMSLYVWILHLPGVGSIRAVTRVVMVLAFPTAGLVALGVQVLAGKTNTKRSGFIVHTGIVVVAITSESLAYNESHVSIADWQHRQLILENLAGSSVRNNSIPYVANRDGELPSYAELDGMIFAQDRGLRTVNGYSGNTPPGYGFPHPCADPISRMYGYSDFNGLPRASVDKLRADLLTLSSVSCRNRRAIAGKFRIEQDVARALRLSFEANVNGPQLAVRWTLKNHSIQTLDTISPFGPIELSWRFVPIDCAHRALGDPPWLARSELTFSLPSDEAASGDLLVTAPKTPGQYRLELSMVQEQIAWFHDLGTQIPSMEFEVGSDGEVRTLEGNAQPLYEKHSRALGAARGAVTTN